MVRYPERQALIFRVGRDTGLCPGHDDRHQPTVGCGPWAGYCRLHADTSRHASPREFRLVLCDPGPRLCPVREAPGSLPVSPVAGANAIGARASRCHAVPQGCVLRRRGVADSARHRPHWRCAGPARCRRSCPSRRPNPGKVKRPMSFQRLSEAEPGISRITSATTWQVLRARYVRPVIARSSATLGSPPIDRRPSSSTTLHFGRDPPGELPLPRRQRNFCAVHQGLAA